MNQNPGRTPRHAFLGLLLIILLGAFLRIDASLHTEVQFPLRSDAGQYFSYAFNLRHGGIYSSEPFFAKPEGEGVPRPDALRSPGYPIALLPFAGEVPSGRTILNITLMQALLGILMVPLVFLIARRIVPDKWALLPAALVAVSPQLVNMGVYILSESLFSFLLLLSIYCMLRQFKAPERSGLALLGGVLIGCAALTRPTLQYLLPLVLLAMLPLLPGKARWRQAGLMSIGFLGVFLPWIARNLITLGVTSDPTLSIETVVFGHYPNMMYPGLPESMGYPYRFDPQIGELSASMGAALHGIWQRFVDAPALYARWYLLGKPLAFFSWGDVASAGDIFTYPTMSSPYYGVPLFTVSKLIMEYSHYLWVGLALLVTVACALPSMRGRIRAAHRIPLQLLACVVVYFTAIHVVGFPIARYCIPLLPVIFILATYGIVALIEARSGQANQ
ncbi:MAG: phospholipid carrier-dependent glycosyltransferase [Rhodocyclales bacterium GT-UBC]|nr:MAG: phospholipid carrier-dependent glycosyltransferase [Rhodocyclales bacterium GT-UBC]